MAFSARPLVGNSAGPDFCSYLVCRSVAADLVRLARAV
jgi:hypothetical protein